ncbi:uncharacterized protein BO87DRAFT_422229 [Aspergillus neoniger CBS 115656]|uniref:Uncharacterized protein n=1 Tax=Aspergillus neoniger (strain CBS 115656) TaxID=1448310 RepID=A0A318ZD11_ASPNB|nr:hypothetical protein BO87DRAFT_422229 [Aspergillus neoniger CBS 115656]PYH38198.1 hypothetical protein BO87DRAFT_422229 [Aspergillus neoniger CBS 115656]
MAVKNEQLGGCLLMCTSSNLVSVAFEFLLLRNSVNHYYKLTDPYLKLILLAAKSTLPLWF